MRIGPLKPHSTRRQFVDVGGADRRAVDAQVVVQVVGDEEQHVRPRRLRRDVAPGDEQNREKRQAAQRWRHGHLEEGDRGAGDESATLPYSGSVLPNTRGIVSSLTQSDDRVPAFAIAGLLTTIRTNNKPMPRHLVRVIIFSFPCAVFCASAPAHAQAVDSFNPGTNGVVIALATQPDGKLLVGGSFGQLGGASRNDLGRFNSDGSLDANFNPGVSGEVFTLVVQPDGKILVGGSFTMLGGGGQGTVPRQNIGRLNADGSIDATFDPGTDGLVEALALQPDGKILVGGFFTRLGGGATGTVPRRNLGRLNSDGSIDPGFNPGADLAVYTIALQPDDKILIGGIFSTLSGGARSFIGRLESDGSLDPTFDPGASGGVISLVVQADGRILVVGGFTLLGGGGIGTTPRRFIGRLHADGSLDAGFDPGVDHGIASVGIQANGQILVGGFLTMLGGGGLGTTPRSYIGRLGPDGSLDALFNPGANSAVSALVLQADGKVVVAGAFTGLGGGSGATPRNHIGRVTNTDPASQTLTVTGGGSVINWSRGGSAPEVWRVTFESSADGVNYTPLGRGTRVAGGWQLSGQNLPPNQNLSIRARGYYLTGGGTITGGGSGSIVESILALQGPSFTVTPVAGANGTIIPVLRSRCRQARRARLLWRRLPAIASTL